MISKLPNFHSEATTHVYDAADRKTLSQQGNGTRASMTYDAANRMNGVVNLTSTNTTLSYFNYAFDGISDRMSIWETTTGSSTCP